MELNSTDSDELLALKELCATLGNLPLALTQAGSYVSSREMRFVSYSQLFQQVDSGEELINLLPEVTQHHFLHDHQRAILTTWKINPDSISEDEAAVAVLRLVALLGSSAVPEPLTEQTVSEVLDDAKYFKSEVSG